MTTKEGDHGRATYLMRTGYLPDGPIQYPTLGSLVAKELGDDDAAAAQLRQHRAVPLLQPGRVRPRLPRPAVRPADRRRRRASSSTSPAARRLRRRPQGAGPRPARRRRQATTPTPASTCSSEMEKDFVARHPGVVAASHQTAYERAVRLMQTDAPQGVRPRRGEGQRPRRLRPQPVRPGLPAGPPAGRARRAVRRGDARRRQRPAFGWDTHAEQLRPGQARCASMLDPAWATLMERPEGPRPARQHADRLDGRVRPHAEDQPAAAAATTGPTSWTTVLAGGGIKGGQAVRQDQRRTAWRSRSNPVSVPDFMATVVQGAGPRPDEAEQVQRRPADPLVDKGGKPIKEVLG